jgi:predicted metal-dependent hydrolase
MSPQLYYKLIRARRRTLSLSVSVETGLTVRAPLKTPLAYIEKWVQEKSPWIDKVTKKLASRPVSIKHHFTDGELFLYKGEKYPFTSTETKSKKLEFSRDTFILAEKYNGKAKKLFTDWYKEQALEILSERTQIMANQAGLSYSSVRVTSATRRWGSCSKTGRINFTWRLIMAPLWVIDYVIAHELAHLEHHNHSKAFWAYTGTLHNKPKEARAWLKQYGHQLTL